MITPLLTLPQMWPWAGEYPNLLRLTALLDLCGGFGIVLPALTRIKPQLTILAALGCATLMIGVIVFHLSRIEAVNTPFNFVMLPLAFFVVWGRRVKVPIITSRRPVGTPLARRYAHPVRRGHSWFPLQVG